VQNFKHSDKAHKLLPCGPLRTRESKRAAKPQFS